MQQDNTQKSIQGIGKVFQSGKSQAVRIPVDLRLETDRVKITKTTDGNLLLQPLPNNENTNTLTRGQQLLAVLSDFDKDFIDNLENRADLPMQDREAL